MAPGTRPHAIWCHDSCRVSGCRALALAKLSPEALRWARILEGRGWLRRHAITTARTLACRGVVPAPAVQDTAAFRSAVRHAFTCDCGRVRKLRLRPALRDGRPPVQATCGSRLCQAQRRSRFLAGTVAALPNLPLFTAALGPGLLERLEAHRAAALEDMLASRPQASPAPTRPSPCRSTWPRPRPLSVAPPPTRPAPPRPLRWVLDEGPPLPEWREALVDHPAEFATARTRSENQRNENAPGAIRDRGAPPWYPPGAAP